MGAFPSLWRAALLLRPCEGASLVLACLWVVGREEGGQPPQGAVTDARKHLGCWSHWHGFARMVSGWSASNRDGGYPRKESVDSTCVHRHHGDTGRAHGPQGWELTCNHPSYLPYKHLPCKRGQLPLTEQQKSRWVPFTCCFASHFQHTPQSWGANVMNSFIWQNT